MTAYSVLYSSTLVSGQPEDVSQVKANFDAIATVINGNLDQTNISPTSALTLASLVITQNNPNALRLTGLAAGITFGGDVTFYRNAHGELACSSDIISATFIGAGTTDGISPGSVGETWIGAQGPGGESGILFGNLYDANLYRKTAGVLQSKAGLVLTGSIGATNGGLMVCQTYTAGMAGTRHGIIIQDDAGHDTSLILGRSSASQAGLWCTDTDNCSIALFSYASDVYVQARTQMVIQVGAGYSMVARFTSTKLEFGSPGPPYDTNLYRNGAGQLKTDGVFTSVNTLITLAQVYSQPTGSGGGFVYNPSIGGGSALYSIVQGAANPKFYIGEAGSMWFGAGGASTVDLNVYREAAGILRVDTHLVAAQQIHSFRSQTGSILLTTDTGAAGGKPLIWFGIGLDTNLYRNVAGNLITDGFFTGKLGIYGSNTSGTGPAVGAFVFGDANDTWHVLRNGKMEFGAGGATAVDANFYRKSAKYIGTDHSFFVGDGVTAGSGIIVANPVAAGNNPFEYYSGLDSNPTFRVLNAGGKLLWGPGGASAPDVTLSRNASHELLVDGGLVATATATSTVGFTYFPASATGYALRSLVSGEANSRLLIDKDGAHQWGPGGGTALDVLLQRSAARRLQTDALFDATTLGIATKVKAGTPVDGDWAAAPPTGTIVVDTTANKIWVRTAAATWKGVVVA